MCTTQRNARNKERRPRTAARPFAHNIVVLSRCAGAYAGVLILRACVKCIREQVVCYAVIVHGAVLPVRRLRGHRRRSVRPNVFGGGQGMRADERKWDGIYSGCVAKDLPTQIVCPYVKYKRNAMLCAL